MSENIRIVMAQLNLLVGDIRNNAEKIISAANTARDELKADLIVFPELALTGYPPEDLLLRKDFHAEVRQALENLKANIKGIDVLLGYPERVEGRIYNAACVIRSGKIIANYHKQRLPNYGVFDEKRYFKVGTKPCVYNLKDLPIGINICEDIWFSGPVKNSVLAGAKLIISINASPFDIHKVNEREKILHQRVSDSNTPILYVHCVGGQDEVIFDGRSIAINEKKEICCFGKIFEEELIPVDIDMSGEKPTIICNNPSEKAHPNEKAYGALVCGVKDYATKNGFNGVALGLSGGIDSALTLAIAVDALGKDNVHAVMMPSRYTSDMSLEDAKAMADLLEVKYSVISIEPAFEALLKSLEPEFKGTQPDATEENLQARIRGNIIMALSNKFGYLVLTTSNKSESAVGYATLYGDMAGGYAVLKDVYKTLVYDLSNYRNQLSPAIPQRIIDRPPSAELAHNQIDQDSLPDYDELDKILMLYVEEDKSAADITAAGFDNATVGKVLSMIDRNEFKRRQGPPGPKITTRAFGRDRRYPITSGFKP